jgi:hypothetical protein
VASAADRREDPALTLQAVRAVASAAAGVATRAASPRAPGRRRAPRLTEAWFC